MPLTEEAATWFLRLRSPDCSDDDRQAFESWLTTSDDHRREYERFTALWKNLDRLDDYTDAPKRKRRRRTAVAALSLVLAVSIGYLSLGAEHTYTTAIGEHRRIELADGSVVDLNTGSEMRVHISVWARRIELTRGEAMFDVVHETLRSFEVRAAGTVLRDVGTRFNVQLEQNAVAVSVLEGVVEVKPPSNRLPATMLAAGTRVVSDFNGLSGLTQVDAESAAAWVSGRWVFRNTSLEEVVRELNRYHPQKTELADPMIGKLRIDGVFNTSDRTGLLKALETLHPLRVEEDGGTSVLNWKRRNS
jgi:transmembrane sensor